MLGKRLIKSNEGSSASSGDGPDISSYTYNSSLSDTTGVATGPYHHGYFFLGDSGTKLYIATTNYNTHTDDRYPLSTAYDFSSRGARNQSVGRNPPNHYNTSIFFKPDGTKYYMMGYSNGYTSGSNTIVQATMSTPWDLTSATIYNGTRPGSFQGHHANSITFSSDGSNWFYASNVNASNTLVDNTIVRKASLSTAWDFSSTHTIQQTIDLKNIIPEWVDGNYYVSGDGWTGGNFWMYEDGLSAYLPILYYSGGNYQSTKVYRLDLTTAYDLSTLNADNDSYVTIAGTVFTNAGANGHGNIQIVDNGDLVVAAKGGNYKFFTFN